MVGCMLGGGSCVCVRVGECTTTSRAHHLPPPNKTNSALFNMLQSTSAAVSYEAAWTLVSLSSAPTAVRAAASTYAQLLNRCVGEWIQRFMYKPERASERVAARPRPHHSQTNRIESISTSGLTPKI